jgi:hypothetical protein
LHVYFRQPLCFESNIYLSSSLISNYCLRVTAEEANQNA